MCKVGAPNFKVIDGNPWITEKFKYFVRSIYLRGVGSSNFKCNVIGLNPWETEKCFSIFCKLLIPVTTWCRFFILCSSITWFDVKWVCSVLVWSQYRKVMGLNRHMTSKLMLVFSKTIKKSSKMDWNLEPFMTFVIHTSIKKIFRFEGYGFESTHELENLEMLAILKTKKSNKTGWNLDPSVEF